MRRPLQPVGVAANVLTPDPGQPQAHQQQQQQQQPAQSAVPDATHVQWRTPGDAESGGIIFFAASPEYFFALARARRRFFGALMWALLIWFAAAWVSYFILSFLGVAVA